MQRLFSIFPNSWPGVGLLLLRVCAAISLIAVTFAAIRHSPPSLPSWIEVPSIVVGALLLFGFGTPIAAIGQVIIESWLILSAPKCSPVAVVSIVVGISLIMLGPGAWSVDSRLFGRRRIELPRE